MGEKSYVLVELKAIIIKIYITTDKINYTMSKLVSDFVNQDVFVLNLINMK